MSQANENCVQNITPPSQCCVQWEAAACIGTHTRHCYMFNIYRCGLPDLMGPNTDCSPKGAEQKGSRKTCRDAHREGSI